MAPTKLILFFGVAIIAMPPTNSAHIGKFECAIPMVYRPVCGSDGYTYDNEWHLNCDKEVVEKLTMLFEDPCDEAHRHVDIEQQQPVPKHILHKEVMNRCITPLILSPVCASDGRTYGNKWEFECNNRVYQDSKIISFGECKVTAGPRT